ncbi:MAG: hypothetical protein H0V66_01800 [Bdellovibrionales bacterium]|nr:hypothetical protein [Bdellovibrionales bacterium]
MKLVGFVFLLALSAQNLHAKSPRNLIKSLNKLNARPLALSINQCSDDPEYISSMRSENEDLLQQCAIELCGKPSEAVSGSLNDRTYEDYVEDGVLKRFSEIESEIKDLVKADVVENNKFITDFKSKMTDGKLDFKFDEWNPSDYSELTNTVYAEHADIVVDQKQVLAERLTIKPIYPKGATETFKKGLDSYIVAQKELLMKSNEGFYYNLYTKEESKQMFQKNWDKFYADYLELIKTKPDALKDYKSNIEQLVEEIAANTGDPYETANSLSMIKFLSSELVRAQTGAYPEEENLQKCGEKECQLGVQEFLNKQDLTSKLAALEKANNSPELIKDTLILCKSNLASRGLKASDSESMLKLAPELKKRFVKFAAKGFSSHSKTALEKYLADELHLSFKLPASETVQSFIDDIHESHKSLSASESVPEEAKTSDLVNQLIGYDEDGSGANPLAESHYCSQEGGAIWDAFYPKSHSSTDNGEDMDPTKDNIQVSKFSCTHLGHGQGVLAHEMGHAMSYAFTENKLSPESLMEFKKLRACANSHHKEPSLHSPYPDLKHDGDTLRTEEDTADLLSYMTLADDGLVFECALLETNKDESRYIRLGLENVSSMDTHSSPLFRALQEATHKGRVLPEACNKVIQEDTKFGFEKCF